MNRPREITRYTKHNDATTTAPIKCKSCDQLFANDTSYQDHLMDCKRKPNRHSKVHLIDAKVTA